MALWRVVIIALAGILVYNIIQVFQHPVPDDIPERNTLRALRGALLFSGFLQKLGYGVQRAFLNSFVFLDNIRQGRVPQVKVTNKLIDGVPVLYLENGMTIEKSDRPAIVFFHGGGWTLFSPTVSQGLLKKFSREQGYVIISVDYRLAPEHPFPAAYEDCLKVARYVVDNAKDLRINPRKIAVAGDSAGGNLAAAVALELKNKILMQFLIYPCLQAIDFRTPSYMENKDGALLTPRSMIQFWVNYGGFKHPNVIEAMLHNQHVCSSLKNSKLADYVNYAKIFKDIPKSWNITDQKDFPEPDIEFAGDEEVCKEVERTIINPRFAPLMASDAELKAAPKAYVLTSGYDVLRDEGVMYAHRLKKAGVEVIVKHWHSSFHGFFPFGIDFSVSWDAGAHLAKTMMEHIVHGE